MGFERRIYLYSVTDQNHLAKNSIQMIYYNTKLASHRRSAALGTVKIFLFFNLFVLFLFCFWLFFFLWGGGGGANDLESSKKAYNNYSCLFSLFSKYSWLHSLLQEAYNCECDFKRVAALHLKVQIIPTMTLGAY